MQTIKVNAGQNKEIFESISELIASEDANTKRSGSSRFYEKMGDAGTQFIIDASRSGPARIVFSTPGEGEDVAYELDTGSRRADENKLGFDENGATWFKNLREGNAEPMESPDSDWAYRRDRIADAYHRKYFTVEYVVDQNIDEAESRETVINLTDALGEAIYSDAPIVSGADRAAGAGAGAGASKENSGKGKGSAHGTAHSLLSLKLNSKEKDEDDIYYSAKLKINATLGVGQAIPLIGRVYYRFEDRNGAERYVYTMLTRDQAKDVDASLSNIPESKNEGLKSGSNEGDISATLKTRLETDLNSAYGSEKLTDCLLFSEESMKVLLEHRKDADIGTEGHTTLYLECKSIELISVAKIMWPNLSYDIMYRSRDAFAVNYSITGITMRCKNCAGECRDGEDILIRGGYFVFPDHPELAGRYSIFSRNPDGTDDASADGIRRAVERFMTDTVVISEDGEAVILADSASGAGTANGGKTANSAKTTNSAKSGARKANAVSVYSLSAFARHLSVVPTCEESATKGDRCFGTRICDCQRLNTREGVCLCRRCVRPENVYLNTDGAEGLPGERYVATASLFFDAAAGHMTPRALPSNYQCRVCGGIYNDADGMLQVEKEANSGRAKPERICRTCGKAMQNTQSEDELNESKELFKKYKKILTMDARIAALVQRHGCAENERYIIFRVGSSMYKFDKLSVTDKGYIKAAEKLPYKAI